MMTRMSPTRTALMWLDANALLEVLGRSVPTVRVRYEDMVDDPGLWVGRVLASTGVDPTVRGGLAVHHAVGGNPVRFRPDRGLLRVDREWRQKLSPRARRTVTSLTAPMLWRYGYSLDARCRCRQPTRCAGIGQQAVHLGALITGGGESRGLAAWASDARGSHPRPYQPSGTTKAEL